MFELIKLFLIFFRIGLLSIGGGLSTIPFLRDLALNTDLITIEELSKMIAIAESTPGPIGINLATYIGYNQQGIISALVAVLGLILPSIIIIILISIFLSKFKENKVILSTLKLLRPVSIALIIIALISVLKEVLFLEESINYLNTALFIAIFTLLVFKKTKKINPIYVLIISALLGIIFKL